MESSDITTSDWNEEEIFNNFEASTRRGSNEEIPDSKVNEIYLSRHKEKILKAIVKRRKLEIIRKLIENPQKFVNNVSLVFWIELINFAAEKEFFDLYEKLKVLERVYKDQFGKEPEYKYKHVQNHISTLHTCISQGEINFVKFFIKKYPKLKLCYLNIVSALERSIDAESSIDAKFEIFGLLLSKGFDANENCIERILEKIKRKREEILKCSYSGLILKSIVSYGKLNFLQIFTRIPLNFNDNVDFWIELINLTAESEFFELYDELKRFENSYERKLNDKALDSDSKMKQELQLKFNKYKDVLGDISELHADISNARISEIEKFIRKYPQLKLCYGLGDVSALESSINASDFEIFELLLVKGFNSNERFYPKLLEKIEQKREEMLKSPMIERILRAIVIHRRSKILNVLIQNSQSFTENVDLSLWNELIKLAAENDFFDIFEELKKLETDYKRKKNFKIDYEYKNVLDDISKLHADIYNGTIDEIEKFIKEYPKLKLCYGSSDFCALERSIDARQFYTYAFLRAKGFYSDKGKELKDKIDALDDEEKEEVRHEISKFTISDLESFISLVLTKCEFDVKSSDVSFNEIREMLQGLSQIEEFKPILEILAISDVRIIFDLKNEFVTEVDPTAGEQTLGIVHFVKRILYIGNNQSRDQRFGTFAHEATHFALFLLYENYCLPYREEDDERESDWVEVVRNIREIYENDPSGTDNIIKWVYNPKAYPTFYHQKAELIVRVNDLLAFYHKNPQKCEEVRETYRELFDFYRTHVMPDLTASAYRIIKLNNELKLFEKIRNSKFQVKHIENLYLDHRLQSLGFKNFLFLSDVPQLTLSKLFKEIFKKSSNKLEAKVKNIFINLERLHQESLRKELEEVLRTFEVLRVIVYLESDETKRGDQEENSLKFLRDLIIASQIFLVAYGNEKEKEILGKVLEIEDLAIKIGRNNIIFSIEKPEDNSVNKKKFLKLSVKQSWADLIEKSKADVMKLKVKFREDSSVLSLQELSLEAPLTNEVLRFLSSTETPRVDPSKPDSSKLKFFIVCNLLFKIDESTFKSMDIDEFINQTKNNKGDKIVVISDLAGSGKTTLLHKFHQNLHKKFQNFWICFVSLLKHKDVLCDDIDIGGNFLKLLVNDVLKLNELEKKIFEFKYEANQVVILFDGFDEISPDCKRNAIKIFKLHKQSEKSQIWVTTRTHLEEDLEKELKVEAHKIEPFALEKQKKFLTDFWEESCDDTDLRKKCANFLVQKISEINDENPNLIGIALQLRLLGEKYKNKLSEKFDEDEKDLSIFHVYESLVRASVLFKPGAVNNFLQQCIKYQALALKNFFDKTHHLFGLSVKTKKLEDLEELEEFTRGGLTSYDKDGNIYFNHLTVIEFLISQFVSNQVQNFKENWEYEKDFCEFLKEILSVQKFEVVRKFLNDAIKKFSEAFDIDQPSKSLKAFSHCFCNHVIKDKNHDWIYESVSNGPSLSLDFVLKCINFMNSVAHQEISDKIKTVLDDIKKLHNDIASGNIEEVQNFILKYPKCKICCGLDKFTALERSIDNKQLKVYAFLKAKKFSTNHKVRLQSKVSKLKDDEKEEIHEEIIRLQVDDPEIFVDLILEAKCDLETCKNELPYANIEKTLHDLRTIEEFKPILDVLIFSDAKLIFDAKKEKNLITDLEDYEKSVLYVDKISNRNQRYQKFAHEVTKYVFYIFYENNCLPYRVEDKERESALKNVVQEVKSFSEKDFIERSQIIESAFSNYSPGSEQNAEVIACVNNLLAFYFSNAKMNMKIREDYKAIFNYYKDCVMPDLSIKNAYRIIKLNNKFELFSTIESSNIQMKDYKEVQLIKLDQFQNLPHKFILLLSDVPQLTLSKLVQEISKSSENKLHLKVKNIFINFERLEDIRLRVELKNLENTSEISRIIIFLKNIEENFEQILEFLSDLPQNIQIFLVAFSTHDAITKFLNDHFKNEVSNFEIEGKNLKKLSDDRGKNKMKNGSSFLKVTLKHSALDLQEKILKKNLIKFREENYNLISIFSSLSQISVEILNILSLQKNFEVTHQKPGEMKFFIERYLIYHERYGSNVWSLSLKDFIDLTRTDKIVVISDFAGMGKTTLLHKIHQKFDEKFKSFWICFVSLLKHKKILLDRREISENFLDLMTVKILKLNAIEKKIFEMKYENNQVVILFDGFDEISPDCKRNAIKIFKLHKQSEKSQIWITTRTHLEEDLERELQVEAHKIKPLNEFQEIEFLCKFWEESCDDSDLREKCANILVKKISEMNQRSDSLIGITLQIQIFGEYFEDQLSDDFDEKLKNLNFYQVYEFLIEKSVKFKEEKKSLHNTLKLNIDRYEALVLKFFFARPDHHLFGFRVLIESLSEEVLEELTRGGIIFYDKDKKVFFTNLTYGEFLLSKFVKNQIKNFRKNWKYEKDFFKLILEILSEGKFKIVKKFLDDVFKDLWNVFKAENLSNLSENEKNFASSFCKFIKEEKILKLYAEGLECNLSSFSFYLLKLLKFEDKKTFEKVLETSGKKYLSGKFHNKIRYAFSFSENKIREQSKSELLCRVIHETKNLQILEEFVGDFFEFYPKNEKLFEFLNLKGEDYDTTFKDIAKCSLKNFEVFWLKIEERKFNNNEIKILESALHARKNEE